MQEQAENALEGETAPHWLFKAVVTAFLLPVLVGLVLLSVKSCSPDEHGEASQIQNEATFVTSKVHGADERLDMVDNVTFDYTGNLVGQAELALNELEETLLRSENASREIFELVDEILDERKRWEALEGSQPHNNFGKFLQHYHGIDGYGKMENALVHSLVGREIEWALLVDEIVTHEERAIALFRATRNVCEECEQEVFDRTFIHIDASDGLLTKIGAGDYVHVRGVLALLPEENHSDWSVRERMHIHWRRFRFFD